VEHLLPSGPVFWSPLVLDPQLYIDLRYGQTSPVCRLGDEHNMESLRSSDCLDTANKMSFLIYRLTEPVEGNYRFIHGHDAVVTGAEGFIDRNLVM
jgi:hypothetical protein